MFEGLYDNIQRRPVRRPLKDDYTLADFLSPRLEAEDNKEIIKSFIRELKGLLELDSVLDLIEGVHEIQGNMAKIQERYLGFDLPSFYEFNHELSPLLLQKYWERAQNGASEESVESIFLESIHIALEEEIYIWQEKIQD